MLLQWRLEDNSLLSHTYPTLHDLPPLVITHHYQERGHLGMLLKFKAFKASLIS